MTHPAHHHTDTEAPLPGTHTAEQEWPITTWQGWQHFATTPPLAPPQPGFVSECGSRFEVTVGVTF